MTSAEIRQQFLDFFIKKHGHTFVPSSSVVPLDDPTLLFTNAGMNQFKPIFLGQEKRAYTRAANTQKCIRAGGKHNDLDDVGRSRRHGTFFEMLGNWSFGDYFKRGAIEMAWELMTEVWKLDPSRLHVTCYEGDDSSGIPRDTEAVDLWKQIAGLPDDHIHYFGKDNFWEMGDTGPCGPCSEIYIDRTPDKTGGKDVNGDDPRVMEFWNLVFIQYNRNSNRSLTPLPARHVDTGMGFERICSILQDKTDMYGIDLFDPFFSAIADLSGKKYTGAFPKTNVPDPAAEAADEQLRHDIAFRVIADHIRTLTFALTDGAVPSNEGRGYVLRRILRRAARFGRQQLGLSEPFLHQLVPVVVDSMGAAFPELKRNPGRAIELIRDEEISFGKTLDRGIQLFDHASVAGAISAADAFKLHDTYGFPIDLTRIMAEERGMAVDIAGYERLMEQARELARAGGKAEESSLTDLPPSAMSELSRNTKPTDDHAKYSRQPIEARVLAIWNGDDLGISPASAFDDEELAVILDRTNFYAEMGGQVGDRGLLASASMSFDVQTTRAVGGYILHIGRVRSGKISVGDTVQPTVSPLRDRTEKNHTGTHLANWALRETLGEGVQQKGSLVDPEKLRFDFSHPKSMTEDEITRVEKLVNQAIAQKLPVYAQESPQDQALKINGLRAVFGEKYPPVVRVVSIGASVNDLLANPGSSKWREFSIEFCGGTHLASTERIGRFAITAEESVSKGIRRIVALTGDAAMAVESAAAKVDSIIARQIPDAELPATIAELQAAVAASLPLRTKRRAQAAIAELQARHRAFEKSSRAQSTGGGVDAVKAAADLLAQAPPIAGGKLVIGQIPGATDDQLRSALDSLRKKSPTHAILLAASDDQKVTFVAAVSDDVIAKGLKAGDWVKQTATVAGGGGGGRPQMAQGSGKDPSKIPAALEVARSFASKFLNH
ncbi:MAG TPA: alanine--tRNA ligase [Tepidisphaeraceae bacterium]|jgi:alanyl-tRNA synthetase|nr:alanine--tRNA ligase [Tepidisphaeraceae bacterium]